MRILLLRTWTTNIGNGFIDKGAKAILSRAFPEANIIEVSGYPNFTAERKDIGVLPEPLSEYENRIRNLTRSKAPHLDRFVNVSDFLDADLAVLPGCILYRYTLEKYLPTLKGLKDRGIPILLLGAGGGDYQKNTQKYVKSVLRQIEPIGLITRDEVAYKCYESDVEFAHNGIDCAFFINDWYQPPKADRQFTNLAFDKIDEPAAFSNSENVIRLDHFPFEQPHGDIYQKIKKYWKQSSFFDKENFFVSDLVEDYLFFYSNARVTHSDRIHACLPTLAYGNRAKFWFETPRGALFDRVLDDDIEKNRVKLDQAKMSHLKSEQVDALRKVVSE
ncbi:polysaccharide pyruvyl transferase [Halalkalicoccus paucihalophilus]|uniref:Polysaccharide pyruvyl transferase n=1 Tax=Halalkalicoccus paucihalophilus TaxID=1008153 RepID=A0A151AB96_9EURY|nr:polysaccharide pyruvyl transferase family protein [Halalkalicoccus paucihalophilus]KYH24899.1 polysaccharide pyruvyl transferase [Halalkalicoccus paucihalophilus]